MLSFFCSNLRQAGIKSFGEFDSLPWKCISLFVELACTLTSYQTTFLRYCLPDSSPLHFHNPETASRVTLAMLGTVFQTDQKTTKQHKQLNNKATKQLNNQTTRPQYNQTTKQPNNQTTKQPNNQTTKQPNNQTTKQRLTYD